MYSFAGAGDLREARRASGRLVGERGGRSVGGEGGGQRMRMCSEEPRRAGEDDGNKNEKEKWKREKKEYTENMLL
jgi:hypothetical protein